MYSNNFFIYAKSDFLDLYYKNDHSEFSGLEYLFFECKYKINSNTLVVEFHIKDTISIQAAVVFTKYTNIL